jgi:hypothetical protein
MNAKIMGDIKRLLNSLPEMKFLVEGGVDYEYTIIFSVDKGDIEIKSTKFASITRPIGGIKRSEG